MYSGLLGLRMEKGLVAQGCFGKITVALYDVAAGDFQATGDPEPLEDASALARVRLPMITAVAEVAVPTPDPTEDLPAGTDVIRTRQRSAAQESRSRWIPGSFIHAGKISGL